MELIFCSQCGISIPDADFAASRAPDGRTLCAEHRPRSPEGSGGRSGGTGGGASSDGPEVELLFCANCRVSIPVVDVESGRARKEFGSVLCALCSEADPGERSARRKAVEAEMAVDAASSDPVALRHCATCGASVPQGHIVTGRARVDGDRVVCERCREASPAARAGAGAGTWVLVGLLVAACLAAGFFGTEYVQNSRKPAVSPETSEAIRALRADLNSRLAAVEEAVRGGGDEGRAALEDSISRVRDQISGDLVALRSDLADLGSELRTADGDAGQRVAKLEGQVANMQEMLRGLAARPAVEVRPAPGPSTPPPDGPPVPPSMGPNMGPDGGPKTPEMPVVPAPDPALTKLRKDFLQDPDPGTRYAAALELIKLRDLGAIPLFARGVTEDDNVIVRRAAANGLGTFRAWNGVPALIQALEDRESYVAQRANFALQSITGQDFGVNIEQSARERKAKATAATKWWEKNKESPPDGVSLESVELPKK